VGSGAVIAMNDNNIPLAPRTRSLLSTSCWRGTLSPATIAGRRCQGRIQEFAFMAAGGAVKLAQRAGWCDGLAANLRPIKDDMFVAL
jgi:hypothetical protein